MKTENVGSIGKSTKKPFAINCVHKRYMPRLKREWDLTVADSLRPYRKRLLECETHEVDRRMEIVKDCFHCEAHAIGWLLLNEEWAHLETTIGWLPWIRDRWLPSRNRDIRRWFMTPDEMASFERLPARIKVWRGCGSEDSVAGLSWTTDRDLATKYGRYAVGWRRRSFKMAGTKSMLVSATVRKAGVFAVKLNRAEHEVVIMPGYFIGKPKAEDLRRNDSLSHAMLPGLKIGGAS